MANFDDVQESVYFRALEGVSESIVLYPDKLVAVGLNDEGIVASADSLDELEKAVTDQCGQEFEYIVAVGPSFD